MENSKENKKVGKVILVLYMELADYTVQCLKALKLKYPECQIHVMAYPVNAEAPFNFDFSAIGRLYNRDKFDHEKIQLFADRLTPDLIICSGWKDKSYIKVIRTWRKKAVTVMCMDNEWHGNLKQRLSAIFARFMLPIVFKYLWVPYKKQGKFGEKLGFKKANIKFGFYTADTLKFNENYKNAIPNKTQKFPKVFICVARYIPQKNLQNLWIAFTQLQEEEPNDWELWNLGQGEGWGKRMIHPKIKHHGFVQPDDMEEFITKSGVFVLPSLFEPWGVVVHEFAAAGFPMLVSRNVGAQQAFVLEGVNGHVFNPYKISDIKAALLLMMKLSDTELLKMGKESNLLSANINQDTWVEQCVQFLEK